MNYLKTPVRALSFIAAGFLAIALCLTPAIGAQTSGTGSIQGTVTDPSGSLVPGAKVTGTNTLTGVATQSTTTGAGRYNLPLLQPGPYTVTITATGFAPVTEKDVTVDALSAIAVNAKLSVTTASPSPASRPLFKPKTSAWAPTSTTKPTTRSPSLRTTRLATRRPSSVSP